MVERLKILSLIDHMLPTKVLAFGCFLVRIFWFSLLPCITDTSYQIVILLEFYSSNNTTLVFLKMLQLPLSKLVSFIIIFSLFLVNTQTEDMTSLLSYRLGLGLWAFPCDPHREGRSYRKSFRNGS